MPGVTMNQLTAEQVLELSELLKMRRNELLDEIRNELELSGRDLFRDLASEVADAGEESVAAMLMDFDIAMVRHEVDELLQVEHAQQRHIAGKANICEDCGEVIGFSRLLANPLATRCVGCQAQHEQFYRQDIPPHM
jgi:DnaK suppressor protein